MRKILGPLIFGEEYGNVRAAETRVPDDVWQAVRAQFSDAELVDLTLLVSTINAWNRLAISFRKLPLM